ncbi:AAA family ATPase [Waterburya agarophytonicola K14]|uniref:non-specific serine/threonine protein kinase n=1 Tax=Waterburya agarophytonicola KI4 TaxID=2874699 RepID=A0A964BR17_9CYAN|nr:ATPase domain-containing protein [Waterburya agarophytonicola]MCC0176702.1 AAA family ATPase [Waterburya agarophytonicola KI4]
MTIHRISTGISGLDSILSGGLIENQAYLIKGQPGSGKTILGFHFLDCGIDQQESSLFISFGESEARLRRNAKLIGINLEKVEFLDLSTGEDFFTEDRRYDIFSPSEVEKAPVTKKLIEAVEQVQPKRVFLDAITQFRFLASDTFEFRKQVQSFLRFVIDRDITLLFTSEGSDRNPDDDLQFMSDGVIELHSNINKRCLRVNKFRGSGFAKGHHDLKLGDRGMSVFPTLIPEAYQRNVPFEVISAGIPEIDELLNGGIERGTTTILSGPSGVGKSTFGIQFMKEAAGRGERSILYAFEEAEDTILKRCSAVNIPVHAMIDRGTLSIVNIEPLKYTPNQFAHLVRQEVEQNQVKIVMIDSTSGYKLSMDGENLIRQLHSLCQYLKNMGVTVILVNETHIIAGGEFNVTEVGLSYLADNLIFLRYLEINGELCKAIGVLKKRVSDFERTLREFEITKYGIKVGEPLTQLRGILSGIPTSINNQQ